MDCDFSASGEKAAALSGQPLVTSQQPIGARAKLYDQRPVGRVSSSAVDSGREPATSGRLIGRHRSSEPPYRAPVLGPKDARRHGHCMQIGLGQASDSLIQPESWWRWRRWRRRRQWRRNQLKIGYSEWLLLFAQKRRGRNPSPSD